MELIPDNIEVKPNSVAIVGWEEGGAGQIHEWLHKTGDYEVCCFVNPSDDVPDIDIAYERSRRDCQLFSYPEKNKFKGLPLITSLRWDNILSELGISMVIITTSDNRVKLGHIEQARKAGFELINAIHPTANLLEKSVLGKNVIVFARAIIGYKAELCDGVQVGINAQLDHHCIARECSVIGPGVVAAGNVTIGKCATVWTNATIINRIRIGDDAVVGAGSVVLKDIDAGDVAAGVPARSIRK